MNIKKLNLERVILVALLIITGINLTITITTNFKNETKPIEQMEGYWIEESPSLQDIKNIELTEVSTNELR